jgi:hypothetical protein
MFWEEISVPKQRLELRKVNPCSEIWIFNKEINDWQLIYIHRDNDVCYCYDYGIDEATGIRLYKFEGEKLYAYKPTLVSGKDNFGKIKRDPPLILCWSFFNILYFSLYFVYL